MTEFQRYDVGYGRILHIRCLDNNSGSGNLFEAISIMPTNDAYVTYQHHIVYLPEYLNTRAGELRMQEVRRSQQYKSLDQYLTGRPVYGHLREILGIFISLCDHNIKPMYMTFEDAGKLTRNLLGLELDQAMKN